MNRREFIGAGAALPAVLSIGATPADQKPDAEVSVGDGTFRVGIMFATGVAYSGPDWERINILVVCPKAAAALAQFTSYDHEIPRDGFGLDVFYGKPIVRVAQGETIATYRRLQNEAQYPCLLRLPVATEPDYESLVVHCREHERYRQSCPKCRGVLDALIPHA